MARPLMLRTPAASATSRTIRSDKRAPRNGLSIMFLAAVCRTWARLGGSSPPTHSRGWNPHTASLDSSDNILSMITPDAPSIVA